MDKPQATVQFHRESLIIVTKTRVLGARIPSHRSSSTMRHTERDCQPEIRRLCGETAHSHGPEMYH